MIGRLPLLAVLVASLTLAGQAAAHGSNKEAVITGAVVGAVVGGVLAGGRYDPHPVYIEPRVVYEPYPVYYERRPLYRSHSVVIVPRHHYKSRHYKHHRHHRRSSRW